MTEQKFYFHCNNPEHDSFERSPAVIVSPRSAHITCPQCYPHGRTYIDLTGGNIWRSYGYQGRYE